MLFLFLTIIILICSSFALDVSLVYNERLETYNLVKGVIDGYTAFAHFNNSINKTGFATLEIKTSVGKNGSKNTDFDQAYTAGLIEGLVTADLIKLHWENTLKAYCRHPFSSYCQKLQSFFDENFQWMNEMIEKEAEKDSYWYQAKLTLLQLQGLIDGYGFHQRPRSSLESFKFKPDVSGLFLMLLNGELGDLETILSGHRFSNRLFKVRDHVVGSGSCSALVKLLPDHEDLYVSQVTWNGYENMLRILKKYHFSYKTLTGGKTVAGEVMAFSSYPAAIMSIDDFYVISSGLIAQETTIGNNNASRWSSVKPKGIVIEGVRNLISNRLASTGREWVEIFSRYNSGTYNNQWMVVDYKNFEPSNKKLNDGLLYVLEQIPGMIVYRDVTDVIRKQSYWPSYNSAYFPEIFNASGQQELVKKFGDWFTYEHTPRANIFRRDHVKVKDIQSMIRIMRYNDYTHDPLSRCNCTPPYSAENAISARCDLNPIDGKYPFGSLGHRSHGGTDMKMTTYKLSKTLQFIAVNGPTWDNLPPFQWSKSDFRETVNHQGHPDIFAFKPILQKWKL